MRRLWAPWRMQYILSSKKETGCFICNAFKTGVSKESLVIYVDEFSIILLNRYPYISGHLLVAPRGHVSRPGVLTKKEFDALHHTLLKGIECIEHVLRPDGINIGMNLGRAAGAGLESHIHYHIVPRWVGDNNAMAVIADTRVISEALHDTWEKLRAYFEESR